MGNCDDYALTLADCCIDVRRRTALELRCLRLPLSMEFVHSDQLHGSSAARKTMPAERNELQRRNLPPSRHASPTVCNEIPTIEEAYAVDGGGLSKRSPADGPGRGLRVHGIYRSRGASAARLARLG